MEKIGWMVIVDGATQEDLFNSLFSIEYFGLTKSWPTEEKINQFRESMTTQGWSLHTNQLNIDEWRFSNSNIANGVIKKEN
uniref:Mobile element protein n=1 Tax=Meloidogyne hapla TaxID=6305 RepID=A0A1I8BPZ1_MELHA